MFKIRHVVLTAALMLAAAPVTVSAATVLIDSGHGGTDPGAIGVNGLYEKVVNKDVSLKLAKELEARGYQVEFTPSVYDKSMSLQDRVKFARASQADLFISIHANSHPTAKNARGTMVLYHDSKYPQKDYPASKEMTALTPESKKLAQLVLKRAVEYAGTENRGIVPSAVYVVRMGNKPSVLIETGFLSNASDAKLLRMDSFRLRMARGIAQGITEYLPSSGFSDIRGHWAQQSILRLKEMNIVSGSGSKFHPNNKLTRAEFVVLLDRIFGLDSMIARGSADGTVEGEDAPLEGTGGTTPTDGTDGNAAGSEATDPESEAGASAGGLQSAEDGTAGETADGGTLTGELPGVPPEDADPGTASGSDPAEQAQAESSVPLFEPSDINDAPWAASIMRKAIHAGLIGGYDDGTIRPNRGITRAEIAALLDRIIPAAGGEVKAASPQPQALPYADVPLGYWAGASIARMIEIGIVAGTQGSTYEPDRMATRAEIAVMLDRYLRNQGK